MEDLALILCWFRIGLMKFDVATAGVQEVSNTGEPLALLGHARATQAQC